MTNRDTQTSQACQSAAVDALADLARAWGEGFAAGEDLANSDYLATRTPNPYRVAPMEES